MSAQQIAEILEASKRFRNETAQLIFSSRVPYIYNPLDYAWEPYKRYLEKYAVPPKRTVFFGMNPGPWGMAQTGVPFGEIDAVREWLEIEAPVGRPGTEHPKRPVTGFDCSRREVSGKRVWALMKERFGTPKRFFSEHFIANYCPLLFFDEGGKNITPDKLVKEDREELYRLCDEHAEELISILSPRFVIGFGKFAGSRLDAAVASDTDINVFSILHPSPANPRANRGWAGEVSAELESAGVW